MSEKENLEQLYPCDTDKPFLFISYSSRDGEQVSKDALELQRRGYNVWLDNKNLDKTKASWRMDAIEAVRDYNCFMLVFYVSASSLTSKPCFDEVMETMSEETCEVHLGPVKMICIDAEEIGDINETVSLIGKKIRESNLDKSVKAEQTRVLSQFHKHLFHSNNERVRIHPADENNRKSDYYTDIIASLPEETRCFAVPSSESVTEQKILQESAPLKEEEHPWGSYKPQGTATICTSSGKKISAIANSLLLKAKGIEKPKMFREEMYDGLDNPALSFDYKMEHMIPFSDMVSIRRKGTSLEVTDSAERKHTIRILPGEVLLYIGEDSGIEPSSILLQEIESISFDRGTAPDFALQYCEISLREGTFLAPLAQLWFMIYEKENTPSVMRFAKDLNYFSKDPRTSLENIREIRIIRDSEAPSPFGNLAALVTEVMLSDGESVKFLMGGTYTFYAMSAHGKLRQIDRSELRGIRVL